MRPSCEQPIVGQDVLADDRHRNLCRALGIPVTAVGFGYRDLDQGDMPPGLAGKVVRRTR